jgi:hypothetical protein
MACFYCAQGQVNSQDAGICRGHCAQTVCVAGIAVVPDEYHADQCNCGCGALICIYDMDAHARGHRSASWRCFPNSVARAGLMAGAAIENTADSTEEASVRIPNKDRRALGRFTKILRIPRSSVPLPFDPPADLRDYGSVSGPLEPWERLAAALVPPVLLALARSWPFVSDELLKMRIDSELQKRLSDLAQYGTLDPRRASRNDQAAVALRAWYEFSPRLAALLIQHGAPRPGILPDFRKPLALRAGLGFLQDQDWKRFPRSIQLTDLVYGAMIGAERGGAGFSPRP